jgi:hypothetical protein
MPIFWPFMKKISITRQFPILKTCFNLLQNIYRTLKHMDLTCPRMPNILFWQFTVENLPKNDPKSKK